MFRGNYLHALLKKIAIALLIAATVCRVDADTTQSNYIAQELNRYLSHVNPHVNVGVYVKSMNTGRVYYSKNADTQFAPASVQKLFTVTSALMALKPTYRFPTRVLMKGKIAQGQLQGDLVFQFNGDPTLTESDIVTFVKILQHLGVHRITGNVIVDDFAFSHIPYPPGWQWEDLSYDFAAPLNTVIIDRNRFGLAFVPGRRAGEKITLIPHLPPGSAEFINQTITTNYPRRNCPMTIFSNEHNQYLVRGCMSRHQGMQQRTLAIRNMQMFTNGLIRELLRQHDIQFHGTIYDAKTPVSSTPIVQHVSAPLSQVIIHLLKRSDNLYAGALLKKIGEHRTQQPGSWQNGLQAEQPILSMEAGVNTSRIHMVDGSGLSKYNLITPRALAQLLTYVAHQNMLRNILVPALPIAGVDGTLAWRMPELARHHLLHAKTGSMEGVSSLAGFVQTRNHGLLAFVIMINNVPKNRFPYILLENHICEFLAKS